MNASPIEIGAVLLALSALGFWGLCRNAPAGYEDERGFHYGEPPQHSDYDLEG